LLACGSITVYEISFRFFWVNQIDNRIIFSQNNFILEDQVNRVAARSLDQGRVPENL